MQVSEVAGVTVALCEPDAPVVQPLMLLCVRQDLLPGQEELPAGLRGRRRDGGRWETAPFTAGNDSGFYQ